MAKQFKVSVTVSKEGKPENVEDLLEAVGGFGKFQVFIMFIMLFLEIPTALLVFVPVFIGAAPTEWLCDNKTISKAIACSCNGSLTPVDPHVSIVTEWGLLCGSDWVSDTITSLQMSGMLFGNMGVAQLSDWYGRRYSFLGITMTMILGSVLTAVAPNPYVYAVARFICGAGFSGFLSLSAVYSIEFMTPKWRPLCSGLGPFGEGIMLLGLLAYYIRPWRSLVWATILPFASILIIFPLLAESPRWLLRNQRIDEAHKVFSYIARLNGIKDEDDLKQVNKDALRYVAEKDQPESVKNVDEKNGKNDDQTAEAVTRFSYLEFCRDPKLRKITLFLAGIWFTWGLVYFGISYNIKNLPGSTYMNVVWMGLVDAIGYPSSLLINNRLGRRRSLVCFMSIAALFLSAIAVMLALDIEMSVSLLASLCFLGRFGTAGARSAARTLTGESFPTSVRVMGIGLAGSSASFAGALAPQLAYLGSQYPSIPFFAFAVLSVGGSLVAFLLKETSGQPLEEQKSAAGGPQRKLSMCTVLPIIEEEKSEQYIKPV